MAEAARRIALAEQPLYREAPNNIEAEQALLGAVLVNNDAFYRVSDFLKSAHFHEPLHRKIFDVAAELIRMGKIANPVTLKTFLPAEEKVGELTVAQYLARLAAEAVTVINPAAASPSHAHPQPRVPPSAVTARSPRPPRASRPRASRRAAGP